MEESVPALALILGERIARLSSGARFWEGGAWVWVLVSLS